MSERHDDLMIRLSREDMEHVLAALDEKRADDQAIGDGKGCGMSDLGELQRTVGEWAEATFPGQTDDRIVRHLREEVMELSATILAAETGVAVGDVADDCADIAILVLTLCHRHGFSLADAIRAKHAVNTGRTWTFDAGRGYDKHVEATR